MADKANLIKRIVFRLVRKRIAGSTSDSVIKRLRELNDSGIHTTATLLNDHVNDPAKARYNTNAYMQFIKQVARLRLNTDVSIRISQLGYLIDPKLARSNVSEVLAAAKEGNMRLWMEDEAEIGMDERMALYKEMKRQYSNVGIEVRPEHLLKGGAAGSSMGVKDTVKVRRYPAVLDKDEANGQSRKEMLDYTSCINRLLKSKAKVTVLDGDASILGRIASANKGYKRDLIVELPLGYNNRKMQKLLKSKLNLSVYVPYGKDWVPYITEKLIDGKSRKLAVALLNKDNKDNEAEDHGGFGEDEE
ncbi:MAG: hypothetical protein KGH66_02285 [Candidatus Micrarchaeota archaeon]|nr:hypothetical protein [Candidatus Micrarchaeota archaeon]